jgi:hypothetical protein
VAATTIAFRRGSILQHFIIPEPYRAKPLISKQQLAAATNRPLGIFIFPFPRRMLDSEDDDFFIHLIDRVVNEVGIPSGNQFAHACNGLCSANPWKQNQILQ